MPEHNGNGSTEVERTGAFEPDLETAIFLDQQQAEFSGMADEFEAVYGFKHDCHCGEDYAAGNVGEITECYHSMMQDALATCARLNTELKGMTSIAQALLEELKATEPTEKSAGIIPPELDADTTVGVQVFENESGPADSQESDDAAGEGFGSARYDSGTELADDGTPL